MFFALCCGSPLRFSTSPVKRKVIPMPIEKDNKKIALQPDSQSSPAVNEIKKLQKQIDELKWTIKEQEKR